MHPAWRRRAVELLRLVGLGSIQVGQGAALLYRIDQHSGGFADDVAATGGDAPRRPVVVDTTSLLLTTKRGTRSLPVGSGAVLLSWPRTVRHERFAHEKVLCAHLLDQHIAQILSMYRINCVLDVGANKGQYGRRLRAGGYRGQIISFEPVARDFAVLERRASADPDWQAYRLALGKESGTITMNVVPGTLSSALAPTTLGSHRYEQLQTAVTETVEIRRLDELIDPLTRHIENPRSFLKMDTQGFDLEVFAGLGDRVHSLIGVQSEVALMRIYEGMPRMAQAIETYEAAGFEISALYPVSRESRTGRVLEYDCVLVRATAR
ncbi:MAG: FkbM family methyltransferase [Sporichthyaceae bacterium]|nr:FkbM family methyltransferase [Sporichthyaceae bacterium]